MSIDGAVVVDASVFLADANAHETGHDDAVGVLEALATRRITLLVPAIGMVEVAAAIARGVGNPDRALAATRLYRQWPGVQIVAVDELLGDIAIDVAASQRLRGCDAVYVALAEARGAALITLDRQQRDRVPETVAAFSPGDALAELTRS